MVTDTRIAREREAMRRKSGSHLEAGEQPDARGMGAEAAEYTTPSIDPQWIDAWKMFVDYEGNEYGVPVKLPRNMWSAGGPNALENLRRPDGGFWFTQLKPERLEDKGKHACFVGECRKTVATLIKLVSHIEAFHFEEARTYAAVLLKIKESVAAEDPRLQRVLATLENPGAVKAEAAAAEQEAVPNPAVFCDECAAVPPNDHPKPGAWLRGHTLGAHKEE